MDNWFIKLHKKMLDWEWYSDKNTTRLFIHLLLKANWKNKKWKWIEIKRWEIITGRRQLAKETWLTEQQIRASLYKLKSTSKSTNELTIKSTSKFSTIKLNNFEWYQQDNQQTTHQTTTTKEYSNIIIKEKNINIRKENKSEIENYLEDLNNSNTFSYILLNSFMNLWHIPKESLEDFKKWLSRLIEINKIDSLDNFREICFNFETYWKWNKKIIKNYKSTFSNNPLLSANKSKYAKKPTTNTR